MAKKEDVKNNKKNQVTVQANARRKLGVVVSDRMDKTVVVRVDVLKTHHKYKKKYRISKKYKAHSEDNKFKIGDKVVIVETRPLSRSKRWIATEIEN